MTFFKAINNHDKALLLLITSLFAGNMSGVLLLPRTVSVLLFPFFLSSLDYKVLPKNPAILMGIWFLWGGLSLSFTPNFSEGLLQLVLLFTNLLLAYEILLFASRARQPLYCIALGWLISLTINNVVGVWEIATDNHLSVSKFGSERELNIDGTAVLMRYANGFFSNYNAFVTFTCCAFPFLYYLLFNAKNNVIRYATFINIIISIYTLFMNASRGGVLSLFVISAIYMYGIMKERKFRYYSFLVFGLLIGFVVLYWDTLSSLVISRQSNINSIEEEARFIVWSRCIKVFANTFGLGTGIGGIGTAMKDLAGNGSVLAPHNAFLEILVQYGVIIFLFFLNYLKRLYSNVKNRLKSPCNIVVYSALVSMPLVFIINSVYLNNPFFWVYLISLYVFSDKRYQDYCLN